MKLIAATLAALVLGGCVVRPRTGHHHRPVSGHPAKHAHQHCHDRGGKHHKTVCHVHPHGPGHH